MHDIRGGVSHANSPDSMFGHVESMSARIRCMFFMALLGGHICAVDTLCFKLILVELNISTTQALPEGRRKFNVFIFCLGLAHPGEKCF